MAQPYVGEIRMFAGNFAPRGWMLCEGQLLPISENETLFNLIGTTYGGDGQSTFALPDLRGRVPVHQGSGFTLAEKGGVEQVTLTANQIPYHSHPLSATSGPGVVDSPAGNILATSPTTRLFAPSGSSAGQLAGWTVQPVGGSQPHENMQPYLVINHIISLFGIFPSQT